MTTRPSHSDNNATPPSTLQPYEIERGEKLLFRLTEFGRILWEVGIDVGPGKMLDLVKTLSYIDLTNKEDFYNTLKCNLLAKHEQEAVFDQMFLYYWSMRDRQGKKHKDETPGAAKRDEKHLRLPPSERKRLAEHMNTSMEQRKELRPEMRETARRRVPNEKQPKRKDEEEDNPQGTAYSAIEVLRKKDFEAFSWDEVQEAKKLMAEMRWQLGMRKTHRKAPAKRGSLPDMRRIVRRNLKYGAELLELTWRETRTKPRPLVIICDISGSMSLYSRLLLHFIHTLSNGLPLNVETFVFGTRLTCITRQLKRRDVDEAVHDVAKSVQDWSGGTRIGDALHNFTRYWARRVLGRGAVVLIISDGWDRGDSGLLEIEMDRLQRSCHRLIWLNPLLGSPDYRPLTIGMKTALPYIDNFLPAHNLDSLIDLGNLLSTIDESRLARSPGARKRAAAAWSKPRV